MAFEHDDEGSDFLVFGLVGLGIGVEDAVDLFEGLELFEHVVVLLSVGGFVDAIGKGVLFAVAWALFMVEEFGNGVGLH